VTGVRTWRRGISLAALALTCPAPVPLAAPRQEAGGTEAPAAPMELDYAVTLEQGEVPKLRCQLTLWNLTGPTEVAFPQDTTFVRLDEPLLDGVVTARSTLQHPVPIERTGPFTWRIEPDEVGEVELAWTIDVLHRDLPAVAARNAYEFPYVAEDHAFLPTAHYLLAPVLERSQPSELEGIRVRLFGPSGWGFVTPWKELRPAFFQPPSLAALRDDILLAGAWTLATLRHADVDVIAAFAPGQERLAPAVDERVRALVPAMLDLFGMQPVERYLFAFARPDLGRGLAGSPKTTSMTLAVAEDLPADVAAERLSHLLAHEFFHVWQRARCATTDALRFVSEGFTDYIAYRTAARTGLLDDEVLRNDLEGQLARAHASLERFGGSLVTAGGPAFSEGGDAYDAAYAGGLGVALFLDQALAAHDAGVEDVLRALWNAPRWDDAEASEGPGLDELRAAVAAAGDEALADLVVRVAQHEGAPDLVALYGRAGVALERGGTAEEPTFRLPDATLERIAGR